MNADNTTQTSDPLIEALAAHAELHACQTPLVFRDYMRMSADLKRLPVECRVLLYRDLMQTREADLAAYHAAQEDPRRRAAIRAHHAEEYAAGLG